MAKVIKFMTPSVSPLAQLLSKCKTVHKGGRVGRCIACRKPLKVHFNDKNVFVGCPTSKKESR
jgi:hypothetical protein